MENIFLDELRERTSEWHTRLEQNILSVNLLGEHVTKEDYIKYLSALYGFVTGFEKFISSELTPFISDLPARSKANLITDDLSKLGQNTNEPETMPESYFRSMYTDPYAALGAFYVMEGSTLGGQLIKKHLQKTLGEEVSDKISYLTAHGDQTGSMWKNFLEQLSATAEKSGKQENIVDGALRTFRLLDQLMTDESIRVV